ncbi:EREBP-like factor [Heracleum sosnowskyi]|uniref:EREBP-like factor n=1 Tax=Heracleum sosnowskyi TaxID=360622 RepID=A0AAD8IZQ8_9APIA|nr:EREBP-like factor [Heracleum sosnowskyi]
MRGKEGPENMFGKYRGVRQRTWGKWVLEICMSNHGERIRIGTFDNSTTAAFAYDEAAIRFRMFGATAKLNFPDQLPEISLQVHTTTASRVGAIIDHDWLPQAPSSI